MLDEGEIEWLAARLLEVSATQSPEVGMLVPTRTCRPHSMPSWKCAAVLRSPSVSSRSGW